MPTLIDVTDRLVIRELDMTDLSDFQKIVNTCTEGIDDDLIGLSEEEFASRHKAYIKYQYGFYGYGIWGIFLKGSVSGYDSYRREDEGILIGIVGIINGSASRVGELSYAIAPGYRHLGYAYEASVAAMEYGRECGFTSFETRVNSNNSASIALAQKLNIHIIKTDRIPNGSVTTGTIKEEQ